MNPYICFTAAMVAVALFMGDARAQTAAPSQNSTPPQTAAPSQTPVPSQSSAPSQTATPSQTTPPSQTTVPSQTTAPSQVATAPTEIEPSARSRHSRHHRRHGGLFSNWCAYNCYAVPPCSHGCYGAYGYSRVPYDEDLPFHYRWDRDASIIDNPLALIYPYTGAPIMRAGEAVY